MHARRPLRAALAAVAMAMVVAGCGGGDDGDSANNTVGTPAADAPASTGASPSSTSGCGVELSDVQAALPPGTPVVENDTPDEFRCNFTWQDGGNWGIDVALVPGGRAEVLARSDMVPADSATLKNGKPYEAVSGVGDQAWATGNANQVSVAGFRGDDVVAADIVFDGPAPAGDRTPLGLNADFLDIATRLAREALS